MATLKTLFPTPDFTHLEPLPDPPREPDMQQRMYEHDFDSMLIGHFADREDVLITGAGFIRNEATNDAERLAPDCLVTFGVTPELIIGRNGYVISEVGKPPDFVLEIASRSTGRRDYTVKRDGYAAYGITEYWRFDHSGGRFHDTPLAGDTLIDGTYSPIELIHESPDFIWGHSEVLGLDIVWDHGDLRVRDPFTGEFLRTTKEFRNSAVQAETERDQAMAARGEAEVQRDLAESERDAAIEELARVRAELRRLQED